MGKNRRKDFQTQGLAYSLDEGNTWVKYDGNPIIKKATKKDFRDPKFFECYN
jgi:fructan beta-fructosidase